MVMECDSEWIVLEEWMLKLVFEFKGDSGWILCCLYIEVVSYWIFVMDCEVVRMSQ